MASTGIPFIEKVPEYRVADGIVYVSVDGEIILCMALRTFRLGMARAERAIAEYEAKRAEVVPLKKKRGTH